MSDEECIKAFVDLLENRIDLTTGFIPDDVTGNLTHQIVKISCGEFTSVSQPEPLSMILRPATAEEQGLTVN